MTGGESEKDKRLKILEKKYAEIIKEMDTPERHNFLDGGQSPYTDVIEAYRKEYTEIINSEED